MKTPLGTEVDHGPGHTVLDGVPALRERGTAAPPPIFGPYLLWLLLSLLILTARRYASAVYMYVWEGVNGVISAPQATCFVNI